MNSRTKTSYVGTTNISGYELKTRLMTVDSEEYVMPEHITPVVSKNKKGVIVSIYWQVRLTKPSKSFNELDMAVDYLSKQLEQHQPKREYKFVTTELVSKKYPTGMQGIYLQSKKRSRDDLIEIGLNLTFKMHNIHLYLGTLNTANKKAYTEAFIKLYMLRKWLESRCIERDLSWMNSEKSLSTDLIKSIPNKLKKEYEISGLEVIKYSGFEAFVEAQSN